MIAASILIMAAMMALIYLSEPASEQQGEGAMSGLLVIFVMLCLVLALLCAIGVIHQL